MLLTADPMLPVPPRLYGGIERIVAGLAAELRAAGCTVGLLAHPESTVEVDARHAWPVAEPRGVAGHARNAAALDRAVRAFRPDVLHAYSRLAYLGRLLPARLPKLMSYQRLPTARSVRLAAALGGRSLLFTGCSAHIAALGARAGGTWRAIPNFVEARRFRWVPSVAPDAPLVFLSRLERIKGAHEAIAIARAVGRRLVIAGNRVDSAEGRAYFESEIAPHLDGHAVDWIGPVDDAAKNGLLGTAAALLLPLGWDEPFGIVMAEALACGTPVVAYRRGAAPEIVRDGVDGFVVDDAAGAIAALARIDRIDRRACRARVESDFDAPVVARAYLDAYAAMVRA